MNNTEAINIVEKMSNREDLGSGEKEALEYILLSFKRSLTTGYPQCSQGLKDCKNNRFDSCTLLTDTFFDGLCPFYKGGKQ